MIMSTATTTYALPRVLRDDEHPGLLMRIYRAFIVAQQRRADEYALACLAQLSPEQLRELGHSPSEIRDLQAQKGRTPPYWV
jgi:hypothetical protein